MKADFLDNVADELFVRLSSATPITCVFPMNRAGLFLRDKLLSRLRREEQCTVLLPEMITIDALVDRICPLEPDEELPSVIMLYRIYRRITGSDMTLDLFYNLGRQLYADFSDVDMSLLPPERVFSNSAEAHTLEEVQIDSEVRDRLLALLGKKWTDYDDSIRHQFNLLWSAIPQIYEEFRTQQLQEKIAYRGARMRYVIDHWDDADIRLSVGDRTYVFVGFHFLLGGERALMDRLSAQSQALVFCDDEPDTNPHDVDLIMAPSANAQAQYVHDWLLAHHVPGEKTAVVMADESLLEPVVYALPQELSGSINITKGYPLRSTQVYSDVISSLTFPLVMPACLNRPEESTEAIESTETTDTTWQTALRLEAIYQARCVICQFMDLFAEGKLEDVRDLKTLRILVRRALDAVSIPFHGEPITDIQVMGVLETRLLDFDHLLVLNVEEGVIPRKPQYGSFIPYYLRKYFGLRTADEEVSIYSYNFFRLFRRCQDVTLVYTDSTSGVSRRSMSRFVMQILVSPQFSVRRYQLVENNTITPVLFEPKEVDQTTISSVITSLSPSAISTYLSCKRRFYLEQILHYRSNVTPGLVLAPNEFGTLVHDTICALANGQEPVMDTVLHPIESMVALKYAERAIQYHRKEPVVKLISMEESHYKPITCSSGTVRVGGRIDRLDIVRRDGVEYKRVVDYKTGSYNQKELSAPSWDAVFEDGSIYRYILQTLIYCYAAEADIPELHFVRALEDEDFSPKVTVDGVPVDNFAVVRDEFQRRLTELVERILNTTEFPLCPQNKCPLYCPFKLLCGR